MVPRSLHREKKRNEEIRKKYGVANIVGKMREARL